MSYRTVVTMMIMLTLLVGCRKEEPTEMAALPTATVTSTPLPPTSAPVADQVINAETVARLEKVAAFDLPDSFVNTIVFSPDSRTLITGDRNGAVLVWERETWEKTPYLPARSNRAADSAAQVWFWGTLALSPDGNIIVTAYGDDGVVTGRDREGKELFAFSYGARVYSVAISPDGKFLAVGGLKNNIIIFDIETQQLAADLISDHEHIMNAVFSPDGKTLFVNYSQPEFIFTIWDTAAWQEADTFRLATEQGHYPDYHDILFSPDGKELVIASTENVEIKFLDLATKEVIREFSEHSRAPYQIVFSPDGSLLASASDDGTLRLWNMETGVNVKTIRTNQEAGAVAFSPDGTLIAVSVWGKGVQVWAVTRSQSPAETRIPPTETPVSEGASAAPEAAPPLTGSGGGLIAFVSDRDGNGEIYVMNADGSNQRRLTHFRDFDGVPTWSPNGKQLAFYTHLSRSKWAIQVMDADGSNQRPLTDNDACDGAPFWSPDGARIVFTSAFDCDPDNREIVIMDADGSNQVKLTDNDVDDYLSAWSPDSQQIAFVSDRDGNDEIYTMNADGDEQGSRNPQRLTFDDAHDYMPAWSPDGAQIAFASNRDGNDEIYVMDADGGNQQRLTDNAADEWFPAWSPDGAQLLFNSKRDGGDLDVYVMNADGTNVRRLTDNPGQDFNAVWQPQPAREQVATWVKTYEGDPRWAALDAVQTDDGSYLLVGATNYSHQNTRQEDIYLVKTDAAGEIVWAKAYGGNDFDRGNAVIQADDGGFVVLGDTKSSGAGDWDMGLLKVDADGNELWFKTFGGPAQERGNAIRRTADGGTILVGSTKSFGAGGSDLYLIKTDDLGNEVWSQTYGGELEEEGYDVHHTADGGFFILAQVLQSARLYTDQNPDIFLLRTDGAGNEIGSQVWKEENVEGGHALLPTSDGNYIIVGITSSAESESDIDFLFLKIDAAGNLVWDRSISDENAVDYGTDVIETSDGGYLITGMFSGGHGAIPLIKTDGSGQVLWTRNLIEGRGNKVGMRVFPAPDGGYMIVGNTDEYRRAFETVLIKTDSEGKVNE